MRDVKLVRLSDDGTHLVLTHEGTGEEFALRVDDKLRGAVVSDRARLGQLPIERQSRLRPKEIQARLRAGESSEDIASAADVPIDRILRYAGPVLAEREYIAEQARRCALRRQPGEGPGHILEEVVGDRLEAGGASRARASWDAWRTTDGRWAISVAFGLEGEDRQAVFSFDPLGRVVVPSDEEARWMVGEAGSVSDRDPDTGPRTTRDGQRIRLAAVPSDRSAGSRDASDGVYDQASDDRSERTTRERPGQQRQTGLLRPADRLGRHDGPDVDGEDTVDLSHALGQPTLPATDLDPDEVPDLDDAPDEQHAPNREARGHETAEHAPADHGPGQAARRPRTAGDARRSRRARSARKGSVPSWDEILFGSGGRGND